MLDDSLIASHGLLVPYSFLIDTILTDKKKKKIHLPRYFFVSYLFYFYTETEGPLCRGIGQCHEQGNNLKQLITYWAKVESWIPEVMSVQFKPLWQVILSLGLKRVKPWYWPINNSTFFFLKASIIEFQFYWKH